MLKFKNKSLIEGVIPPSDCEQPYLPIWIKNSTGSFYIGDSEKELIETFISGKHKCYIDFDSFDNYYKKAIKILDKFKDLFKGPIETIKNSYNKINALNDNDRYFYISYTHGERYLKTSKFDYGVRDYKNALVANITFVKIKKDENGNYTIYTYLNNNWRDDFMSEYSKIDSKSLVEMLNNYIDGNDDDNKTNEDMARLFGIKYAPLIKCNSLNINEIVENSRFNTDSILESIKNGMIISSDVLWDFDEENESQLFNVFGIHMTLDNSALDSSNPHVSIGWSQLGDLSNVATKDELKDLYTSKWPDKTSYTRGADVSQIWMFKDEMKEGDYIVYFKDGYSHIGKIASDYYYDENIEGQNKNYINNRKVEWIKTYKNLDLPNEYSRSAMTQKSVFRLNSFKSLIEELLKGNDVLKDEFDDTPDESIDLSNNITTFDYYSSSIKDGHNLVVYGTPGCGKSYYVEHTLLVDFDYIRTTFYQDYTNTDFVGQILPVVEGEKVTYEFNPGPFTLALEKAIKDPNHKVALVIEELNRGSAASIFGDIFQLLDRKNGVSEYGIKNVNIIKYLNKQFEKQYKFKEIKLPGNFFIFATMNTSDQNVFTLDTAFKRRWGFKKLLNKFESNHSFKDKYIPGLQGEFNKTWEELVSMINDFILSNNDGLNNEDKQLGVYFVDESGMRKSKEDVSTSEQVDAFCYKVLEYLWSDVSKFQRSKWFAADIKSFDELVEEYKKQGLKVFNDDVTNKK